MIYHELLTYIFSLFSPLKVKQFGNKYDISIDPFKDDKTLARLMREEAYRIAKSYQGIKDTELLAKTIYTAFVSGQRAKSVAKQLNQAFGMPKKEAENIYLRWLGKMDVQFRKYRFKDAGCPYYLWSAVVDKKTCPTCEKRNGKVFSWDAPPEGGHPGECSLCPNYCRCIARPITRPVKMINGEYVII